MAAGVRYNAGAMFHLRHPGPRQRYLLAYAAVVCTAAAGIGLIWPGHGFPITAITVVSILSAWLVARVSTRSLRRRLHELRDSADAIGHGDLSQRVEALPHDDFIKLVETLDRMAEQLKERAREQDRLRRQLTHNEKLALIGELSATVAHEINNPLDGLQNCTRIIRRNLDNPRQTRELLDMMDAGLYRIEMSVRRLLTMARDEPINPMPCPLREIFTDAIAFVQPRIDRYQIELVRDFPGAPVHVRADRHQLVQTLINLMINAADAMKDGGRLTVRYRTGEHGRVVIIEITDTGTGIRQDQMDRIFEPFFTTKASGAGTGLGLSVVARIIEAHEGRVEVTSALDEGTCIRIKLPAAEQPVTVSPLPVAPDPRVSETAS